MNIYGLMKMGLDATELRSRTIANNIANINTYLGIAFSTHPGNQASSRGEAKDTALLSSRDAMERMG